MTPQFIHLNVRSSYSLLQGLCDIKEVAERCTAWGMPAVGFTDVDNLFGAVEITKTVSGQGIQPILGISLGLKRHDTTAQGGWYPPDHITFLVQSEQGWKNLIRLASIAYLNVPGDQPPQITLDDVARHTEGLIVLTGGADEGPVARLLQTGQEPQAKEYLQQLATLFPTRLYVELQRHGLHEEQRIEADLVDLAYALGLPLVATNNCRFMRPNQQKAFEVLMAIGDSRTINDPNRRRISDQHYLKTPEEMLALFADLPEATANTVEIAKRCAYSVPTGMNYMPAWHLQPGDLPVEEQLTQLVISGFENRLARYILTPNLTADEKTVKRTAYQARLDLELDMIIRMGFAGYFMIVSDFCRWSKYHDIPVGPGRGSGAGSLVAYALEITNVDPIPFGLYFERFINPERVSLPDFDIDFCQDRREEVIRYVLQKYGDARVAQIITYGTLKAKACIRDVGRVLQMPYGQVSRMAAFIPEGANPPPIQQALDADPNFQALYDDDDEVRQLLDIAMELEGACRNCSTHAAGVIIAGRDIVEICPLYKDPRSDVPATQFEMKSAEAAGLVKFDFLGLKTLTVLSDAVKMIAQNHGVTLDLYTLPLDDKATYALLARGETMGVFQVEGQGIRDLLKKLVPSNFGHISDVLALYRPGPLGSGMVSDFIECRHGRKEAIYPDDTLEEILKPTFGVIVYQEQVMQISRTFAGYTLGGADILRRAMGKKNPAEMAQQRSVFIEGALKTQGPEKVKTAELLFDLMAKFAEYGFNKSHTVAYGLITYQTAYLKHYYPLEFMASSMTHDRGNTEKLLKFKEDLDRMKVKLLPPDINKSGLYFTVEEGALRYALAAIKGAGDEAMRAITDARTQGGDFIDIYDFMARVTPACMNRRQFDVLVKAGAFDCLGENRATLLANADLLLSHMQSLHREKDSNQVSLFGDAETALPQPPLQRTQHPDALELLEHEQSAIGFYLSSHPMQSYKHELSPIQGLHDIAALTEVAQQGVDRGKIAGIIVAKRTMKTKTGKKMAFVTVSDATGQTEVAFFPESYSQFYEQLEGQGPFIFTLRIELNGETLRASVDHMVGVDDTLKQRPQLALSVKSSEVVNDLAALLNTQPEGPTLCTLHYHRLHEEVQFNLGRRITLTRPLMSRLQGLTGVEIQ